MRQIVPKEILLNTRRRLFLIPHMVLGSVFGLGAFLDGSSFTSPYFDAVFDWAPLAVWGAMFLAPVIIAAYAIKTLSWRAYFLTNTITLALSLLWASTLIDARLHHGYDVPPLTFGMWGFIITTCVVIAVTSTNVVRTR